MTRYTRRHALAGGAALVAGTAPARCSASDTGSGTSGTGSIPTAWSPAPTPATEGTPEDGYTLSVVVGIIPEESAGGGGAPGDGGSPPEGGPGGD